MHQIKKTKNAEVVSILTEIASKKAELVDKTPFDDFENSLALKVIDKRLNEMYNLLTNRPKITKEYRVC